MKNVFLFIFLTASAFSQEKLMTELDILTQKLDHFEKNEQFLKKNIETMGTRKTPYAMIYEHTGLFEWELLDQCYYEYDLDTNSVIHVNVDYKPIDDYFAVIPAYFYFESERTHPSIEDYQTRMISEFQQLGTDLNILNNESNDRYGFEGYHYTQAFTYSSTEMVVDCYFLFVDGIACSIYYMTSFEKYSDILQQSLFEIILSIIQFKSATGMTTKASAPVSFDLSQNYPNPFNAETIMNYTVSRPSKVKLEIFNSMGEIVETLIHSYHKKGKYSVNYNAKNLPSGVYVYRLSNSDHYRTQRMVLVK